MSDQDPVAVFRVEARELLEQLEADLLDLCSDLANKSLIDSAFRSLHTLKGSGAMFGFQALAAFTHHCETAFDRVRNGEVAATEELVSAVLAARDHMRALVEGDGEPAQLEVTGAELLRRLQQAVDGASAADAQVEAAQAWRVAFALPANAMSNGINPLGLLDELRELGACEIRVDSSAVPALDELNPAECHLSWTIQLTTDQPRTAIEDVFIFVMDDMRLEIEALESQEPATPPATPAELNEAPADPVAQAGPARDTRTAPSGESVRVPAERLDELMDRVGELVIAQSRLKQLATTSSDIALRSVSEEVERLSSELRDTMMAVRMVPISTLFGRFRRLVHDLSRDTGKLIELTTRGEATELDKTIIERLADPLIHLIRNAADHGLELPDARRAAGKPEAGQMVLAATHAGAEVVITITDDGRGIDREKVRAKAEANGLLEPGAAVSDAELLQMIFQPGFSTAAEVTSLSGRGVGMDVVKRTIEGLRGSIEIASEPGRGAEVSLRIPLTLAIIEGLLVRVGGGRYVIPLAAVEECVELTPDQDARSTGRSIISLRDEFVPFLRLREIFGTRTSAEPHQKMVVVSTGDERVGLVVDQIIGDHQTVIKSLSKLHADVATFSGATILGDGGVALILDVANLVETGQQMEKRFAAAS